MAQKSPLRLRRWRAAPWVIAFAIALSGCTGAPLSEGHPTTTDCRQPREATPSAAASTSQCLDPYDNVTLSLRPVLYLRLSPSRGKVEHNAAGPGLEGSYTRANTPRAHRVLPNGSPVTLFDGRTVLRVPAAAPLSLPTTGALTIQAWVRPEALTFRRTQGTGYVTWLGKGGPGENEYALRMYSLRNTEGRGNRVSAYAFNPEGGKGSGSYFQDTLSPGEWIMVTAVYTTTAADSGYPANSVTIYRGSNRRQTTSLMEFEVKPAAGSAPLQVGGDAGSYFEGAIGKVAVFDRELTSSDIAAQFRAMSATS